MVAELAGISRGEALAVDLHEADRVKVAIRAVLLEPLVPLVDSVLVIVSVCLEEINLLLGEAILRRLIPHPRTDWGCRRGQQPSPMLLSPVWAARHRGSSARIVTLEDTESWPRRKEFSFNSDVFRTTSPDQLAGDKLRVQPNDVIPQGLAVKEVYS